MGGGGDQTAGGVGGVVDEGIVIYHKDFRWFACVNKPQIDTKGGAFIHFATVKISGRSLMHPAAGVHTNGCG